MFDISWGKLVIIGVVALLVIGPKELPAVLRQLGQWMTKIRRMAAEFQGQFNEAMREADMADLKKSFDEVREATSGLSGGNLMTKLADTLGEPPKLEDLDKPDLNKAAADTPAASSDDPLAAPTPPEVPIPETFTEADAHAMANEPLAITREFQNAVPGEPAQAAVTSHETSGEAVKDAKAS